MKLYRNSRSCAGNILFSCANALGSMMDFGIAQKYSLMANNRCSRSKIRLSTPNRHLSNWSPLLNLPRSSLPMTIRILSTKFKFCMFLDVHDSEETWAQISGTFAMMKVHKLRFPANFRFFRGISDFFRHPTPSVKVQKNRLGTKSPRNR